MEGMCIDCPHKQYCSTLCPEAELYVKQDEVSQQELTIGTPTYGRWPEGREKSLFSKRERQILSRLLEGKTRAQISQELDITRESLKKILQRLTKKRDKIYSLMYKV